MTPVNFWALNANCSNMAKDTDFLRGHVQTVPGNMLAKFEARSFERIGSRQRSSLDDGPKFADPILTAVSP